MTPTTKRDLRSLLTVGALTALVAAVFPYRALVFRADRTPRTRIASAAFVTLSDAEERAAMKAASTSWQAGARARRRTGPEIRLSELPADPDLFRLPVTPRTDAVAVRPLVYGPCPYGPGVQADAPRPLPLVAEEPPPPPFSREELLKID